MTRLRLLLAVAMIIIALKERMHRAYKIAMIRLMMWIAKLTDCIIIDNCIIIHYDSDLPVAAQIPYLLRQIRLYKALTSKIRAKQFKIQQQQKN